MRYWQWVDIQVRYKQQQWMLKWDTDNNSEYSNEILTIIVDIKMRYWQWVDIKLRYWQQ